MSRPKTTFKIRDGKVFIESHGITGPVCIDELEDLMEFLEEAGITPSEGRPRPKLKTEYYQSETESGRHTSRTSASR